MGFLEILGDVLGTMAAQAPEIKRFKAEYEWMSDYDLKREYNRLRNAYGTENNNRLLAVKWVFKDRGYFLE